MRKSVWVVLALLAALASPRVSYAQEIDYLQSFTNGFETLKGETQNQTVTPEQDYNESYVPQEVILNSPTVRELPEDATTVDYVNNTVNAFNGNSWSGATGGLLGDVRTFLLNPTMQGNFLIPAVSLVFVWWGVRKTKSIIWTAFRTGRLNLGTSVKRAWYRHKAKEWYG